jgi:hypothetical protein
MAHQGGAQVLNLSLQVVSIAQKVTVQDNSGPTKAPN